MLGHRCRLWWQDGWGAGAVGAVFALGGVAEVAGVGAGRRRHHGPRRLVLGDVELCGAGADEQEAHEQENEADRDGEGEERQHRADEHV